MQHKPRGIMDFLQCIWIIGEMVRELELELVSDLGPKFLWKAMGKGSALFCSRDMIFHDQKSGHSDKLVTIHMDSFLSLPHLLHYDSYFPHL